MTEYKDIFLKYGFSPPPNLYTPSPEDISTFLDYYSNSQFRSKPKQLNFFAVITLSASPKQSLRISDATKFASAFDIDVDFSKLHPDLIQSLDVYFDLNEKNITFSERINELIYSYTDEEITPFLAHFSPGYHLQKTFLNGALYKVREELVHYGSNTFAEALLKADLTCFLTELYEFIQHNEHLNTNELQQQIK